MAKTQEQIFKELKEKFPGINLDGYYNDLTESFNYLEEKLKIKLQIESIESDNNTEKRK